MRWLMRCCVVWMCKYLAVQRVVISLQSWVQQDTCGCHHLPFAHTPFIHILLSFFPIEFHKKQAASQDAR
jgi:hypothetical protein